jgi:hypothetical protein
MTQKQISVKIKKIKDEILNIESMRPGNITAQYNVCGVAGCKCKDEKNPQKHGPYFQLSYSFSGKSKTQFIREQFAKKIEKQNENFKKFKELTKMWITLEIEQSNLFMKEELEKINSKK